MLIDDMLNKIQNVEASDTTGDAMNSKVGFIKIISFHAKINKK